MGKATTITLATTGLAAVVILAGTAIRERSPLPDRVPMAGSSVAEAGRHQSGSNVLRANVTEMRRVLAHAAR